MLQFLGDKCEAFTIPFEGQETGHAGGRRQSVHSVCPGGGEAGRFAGGMRASRDMAGHSPSVAEVGFLRLELRGLREDGQGILVGTLLKEALALGTQEAVTFACDHSPATNTSCGTTSWRKGREARDRDRAFYTCGETLRDRDTEMERNTKLGRDSE